MTTLGELVLARKCLNAVEEFNRKHKKSQANIRALREMLDAETERLHSDLSIVQT
jgi:hypothetical protein